MRQYRPEHRRDALHILAGMRDVQNALTKGKKERPTTLPALQQRFKAQKAKTGVLKVLNLLVRMDSALGEHVSCNVTTMLPSMKTDVTRCELVR